MAEMRSPRTRGWAQALGKKPWSRQAMKKTGVTRLEALSGIRGPVVRERTSKRHMGNAPEVTETATIAETRMVPSISAPTIAAS